MSAPIRMWVSERPSGHVRVALDRLAACDDVQHVAVMPDVHLASGVCIGTVTATTHRILPAAVGGDIGCGVAALRFLGDGAALSSPDQAAAFLRGLYQRIPFIKHGKSSAPPLCESLGQRTLGSPALERLKERDGRLQLGTLGRGNHFLELQEDGRGELWLMIHSGSRAMGPAIREHHLRQARTDAAVAWLHADSAEGTQYLSDVEWARAYARENRKRMIDRVAELAHDILGLNADLVSLVDCDHNHVGSEIIAGAQLWVHRKGALRAHEGDAGVIPGSMGTSSFHVVGRGVQDALCSSSHGAGRCMSRTDARRRISSKALLASVRGVYFDHRLTERLREEAPDAYKDIGEVMRAQRELTRIVRRLQPVLVYKGA